jgi:hypothetical protein
MKKKIILLFIVSIAWIFSFAFESQATTSINVVSTTNIKMVPTSSFDIDISVVAPNSLVGFQFKLLYDQTKFKLNSITVSSGLTSGNFISNITVEGSIIVTYVDVTKQITDPEVFNLFELNFTALSNIAEGDHDLISLDDSYFDEFLTISPEYVISSIETINYNFSKVNRPLRGDVDLNGVRNIYDVARIQLYLANNITLTDFQVLISDVNGDGRVSILDAGRLQLIIAGFITAT